MIFESYPSYDAIFVPKDFSVMRFVFEKASGKWFSVTRDVALQLGYSESYSFGGFMTEEFLGDGLVKSFSLRSLVNRKHAARTKAVEVEAFANCLISPLASTTRDPSNLKFFGQLMKVNYSAEQLNKLYSSIKQAYEDAPALPVNQFLRIEIGIGLSKSAPVTVFLHNNQIFYRAFDLRKILYPDSLAFFYYINFRNCQPFKLKSVAGDILTTAYFIESGALYEEHRSLAEMLYEKVLEILPRSKKIENLGGIEILETSNRLSAGDLFDFLGIDSASVPDDLMRLLALKTYLDEKGQIVTRHVIYPAALEDFKPYAANMEAFNRVVKFLEKPQPVVLVEPKTAFELEFKKAISSDVQYAVDSSNAIWVHIPSICKIANHAFSYELQQSILAGFDPANKHDVESLYVGNGFVACLDTVLEDQFRRLEIAGWVRVVEEITVCLRKLREEVFMDKVSDQAAPAKGAADVSGAELYTFTNGHGLSVQCIRQADLEDRFVVASLNQFPREILNRVLTKPLAEIQVCENGRLAKYLTTCREQIVQAFDGWDGDPTPFLDLIRKENDPSIADQKRQEIELSILSAKKELIELEKQVAESYLALFAQLHKWGVLHIDEYVRIVQEGLANGKWTGTEPLIAALHRTLLSPEDMANKLTEEGLETTPVMVGRILTALGVRGNSKKSLPGRTKKSYKDGTDAGFETVWRYVPRVYLEVKNELEKRRQEQQNAEALC